MSELHIDKEQDESNQISDSNINNNIIGADNVENIENMDDISCTKLKSSVDRFKSLLESTTWVISDEVDDFQGLLKTIGRLKNIVKMSKRNSSNEPIKE